MMCIRTVLLNADVVDIHKDLTTILWSSVLCVIDMVEVSSANTLGFSLHMVGFIMLIPRPSYRLFGGHRHLFYLKPDLQIIWYIQTCNQEEQNEKIT